MAKYTANVDVTKAITKAYGLMDPRIVEDLCKLARDELRINLLQSESWKIGGGSRHYFNLIFREKFEYIYDS